MITADEIVIAVSGKYGTANNSYYLYKGLWYWSLSPIDYNNDYALVYTVYNKGDLYNNYVHSGGGVAPVINLSAEFVSTMSGNGTMFSPFEGK